MICGSCGEQFAGDLADHECELVDAVRNKSVGDPVDHPLHYTGGRRFEPIDVIEDWELPMHLGNAVKYISRAGRKDPGKTKEDLQKAIWYLERYVRKVL